MKKLFIVLSYHKDRDAEVCAAHPTFDKAEKAIMSNLVTFAGVESFQKAYEDYAFEFEMHQSIKVGDWRFSVQPTNYSDY